MWHFCTRILDITMLMLKRAWGHISLFLKIISYFVKLRIFLFMNKIFLVKYLCNQVNRDFNLSITWGKINRNIQLKVHVYHVVYVNTCSWWKISYSRNENKVSSSNVIFRSYQDNELILRENVCKQQLYVNTFFLVFICRPC